VTAGAMEWKKDDIKAFALLDDVDEHDGPDTNQSNADFEAPSMSGNYSKDVNEMV